MILYINACVRSESRTKQLADYVLSKLEGQVEEVKISEIDFPKVDESFIQKRNNLIETGQFDDPLFSLALQFASADKIIIAAPYWDHSFPAILKQYLEQICVLGVTFRYDENGISRGLCKAKALYYVTTVGGVIWSDIYGFGYIETLAHLFFGIKKVKLFCAEKLDLVGADVDAIMEKAKIYIDKEILKTEQK